MKQDHLAQEELRSICRRLGAAYCATADEILSDCAATRVEHARLAVWVSLRGRGWSDSEIAGAFRRSVGMVAKALDGRSST